jgi:hypothetical protein
VISIAGGGAFSQGGAVENLKDCDLYDVLAKLGYRLNRRTRTQRVKAFAYKHNNFKLVDNASLS